MSILQTAFDKRNRKQNKVEKVKTLKNPMDVYAKLEEIASAGYEGLSKEDSAYFLKCFGLFDKGEHFMLRVRIPIGQLNNEQAIRIGEVAKKYGDDYIDITTRMQIELRYLKIENIAKVLAELQEVGLSTFQTGVDNPRNIVADPLEGLAFDNIIDVKPIVDRLQNIILENPKWLSVLPRKFNTGILGSMSNSCNIFGHDCCFVLANKNGEFGFNIYLGARVGIQAKDADTFVTIDEVPSFFVGVLKTFEQYGYRDNRNKNRLHFLLKDVGVEAFVNAVKIEANNQFQSAGQNLVQSQNIAIGSNRVLQRNGNYAHKIIVPSGIFSGTDLIELALGAKEFGTGDLRLTYDQNIYVVDIDKSELDRFESISIFEKYNKFNNIFFNNMIACAGTKTCSFAVIPNKSDAIKMANYLSSMLKIEHGMVRMNWSACPKGCGVHGIADIGFEGCKAKDSEGNRVDGVHLFLGGKITKNAKEGRILHRALPITEAKHHVRYLLESYLSFRERGETFEVFEERYLAENYSFSAIKFYTKINYILEIQLGLDVKLELDTKSKIKTYKKESLEVFDFGLKLFKLLTGEKRYVAVDNDFGIVLKSARKIKRDEVSKLNPNVPKELSEVIYRMTENNQESRASVFSELFAVLDTISEKKIGVACSYCGVGCKFEVEEKKIKAIKNYPTNQGGSCAKGLSQLKTIHTNRLLVPKFRESIDNNFRDSTYEESLQFIASKIEKSNPKRIGFYLSGQMLNEDYYLANKLAKGFVGTANCDTNSRTCMSSAVVGYKKSFGLDYVPVRIEDVNFCNLMILIGANPAEAHVVLFNKIKKAQKQGMKVVVIDPRFTMSAKIADIYIPLKVGTDIDLLNLLSILLIKNGDIDNQFIANHANDFDEYKQRLLALDEDRLLKNTGLNKHLVDDFYRLFKESKNIITAWTMGVNQSIQGVDKNLAINNLHIITGQINRRGSGPFSFTGQPNAMGGREVGGLSTTLAVHLDYSKESCKKVSEFWKTDNLPTKEGLTAYEMVEKDELDVLIICHTDPVYHLPNRHLVEKSFKNIDLVVELNAYNDSETSHFSHIQIPVLPFGAKEGTQSNMDRTVTRIEAFEPKDKLLQDWEIFAKLGQLLGYKDAFEFRDTREVFEEYQEMTKLSQRMHLNLFEADYDLLKVKPFVWGKDIYKEHHFFTNNNKANLFFVENLNLSEQPTPEYPFILLTGRIRDQWHTGSKTAEVKSLLKHKKLNFVEISKKDAKELGLRDGDRVEVGSKRGKLVTEVLISDINSKNIFIPISHKEINYLTDDRLDPISKEPDYNHSAVYIRKV